MNALQKLQWLRSLDFGVKKTFLREKYHRAFREVRVEMNTIKLHMRHLPSNGPPK
jgi:hypothetical protein